ncbi:MAG: DUF1851 domain-containing protein [Gracilibacteraceae bacterium]|jgi:hypothetical protein|nr:DUF1851 domain-containing protein [Gracilibacteraceae bacterium]
MADYFKKFTETFQPAADLVKPDGKILKQYEGVLPAELIGFWRESGLGNYGGGLIKVIDPADYADSLAEWLGRRDASKVPILVTGFGDIFYYRQLAEGAEDVSFLDVHHRKINVCVWSLTEFFDSFIVNPDIINELLRKELFDEALKKKGRLDHDEIYFFVPALIMGGGEDVKYIDKGKGAEHQSLLFQMGNQQ